MVVVLAVATVPAHAAGATGFVVPGTTARVEFVYRLANADKATNE
jgi:hypothetical protein